MVSIADSAQKKLLISCRTSDTTIARTTEAASMIGAYTRAKRSVASGRSSSRWKSARSLMRVLTVRRAWSVVSWW